MRAQLLRAPQPAATNPLTLVELATPEPRANEIRIRVHTCAVCHTDLHIVEGEIHPSKMPIIPGHQIVGIVEARGANARRFESGVRVGVPWLNWIDSNCRWFGTDRENLCENIRFTGFDADGGYAESVVVDEKFAYAIPPTFSDEHAAPLLCAGVVGFRALRLSEIEKGERLGLFGFGASAHLMLQVARHWGKTVYVFTRSEQHQQHARTLGAEWVGGSDDMPPHKLDSAIIFAPVGNLVVRALEVMERGGTVAHAGIHSTPIPQFDYELLYYERTVRSVANSTRRDVEDFLKISAEIPIHTEITVYPLAQANRALQDVKASRVDGAAVLEVRD